MRRGIDMTCYCTDNSNQTKVYSVMLLKLDISSKPVHNFNIVAEQTLLYANFVKVNEQSEYNEVQSTVLAEGR